MHVAAQDTYKTRQKKKAWLNERKSKAKAKKRKRDDSEDETLRDDIKFGTVVQAPPTLTAVPKNRGGKAVTDNPTDAEETRKKEGEPHTVEAWRKKKFKTLAEAEKKSLTAERERVIAFYRAIKSNQASAKLD
ncbi:hypothetical protein BDK51DRAFT_52948 [Blyttiomyces helicus]|uniref:Uncharacterized protein n=1 Tax=Blyttiomyces helicus TaxID=388810 RepID=A0A4P9WGB5_9FUNG|nr:hypothetical protein BDK51DRAFT_52948 [Blyttiomyces helicus]|eukprot:RKO91849.1 hypothetical protein BDK51DRAFT_52948 [Blyttiomyces helicus]